MKAVLLKCNANTQFHFGRYAPDSDTALNDTSDLIHSDTLFAALVRTYNDIYPDSTNDFVKQFANGCIRISSAFFCIEQDGRLVWFLPKPISFDLADTENYKSFRKIKYLSKNLWESLESPAALAGQVGQNKVIVVNGKYAMLRSEISLKKQHYIDRFTLYHESTRPKVHVRKPDKEDSIYQFTTIEIADNSDIADSINVQYYFLYETTNEFSEFQQKFDCTLEVLAESGIGAERSTIGKLTGIEIKEWQIDTMPEDAFMSLSLLSPEEDEFTDLKYYQTIFRGGRRIGGDTGYSIQKSVRMLVEGSVFTKNIGGVIRDVTPESSNGIYLRNGKSLNIPIRSSWSK